jgi:hypothetical protein
MQSGVSCVLAIHLRLSADNGDGGVDEIFVSKLGVLSGIPFPLQSSEQDEHAMINFD